MSCRTGFNRGFKESTRDCSFLSVRCRCFVPVEETEPVDPEVDGAEGLLHLSLEDIGARLVEHVAVAVIDLWEEDRLVDAGGVLKGDEFHGVSVFGEHGLAGHLPADGGDLFADLRMKIAGFHVMEPLQDLFAAIEGMNGEEETERVHLMFQHPVFGVWCRHRRIQLAAAGKAGRGGGGVEE